MYYLLFEMYYIMYRKHLWKIYVPGNTQQMEIL